MSHSIEDQVRALRQSCGLWRRSPRAWLQVEDQDRVRLVNGLVTCETASLRPGEGARGFFTDVRGHILSTVVVRSAEDRIWLELPESTVGSISNHIQKYIIADRVTVSQTDAWTPVSLLGPDAVDVLKASVAGGELPAAGWHLGQARFGDLEARVTSDRELGTDRWTVWIPPESVDSLTRALRQVAESSGILEVAAGAVEVIRVEAGAPRFAKDFDQDNLPQETGLEDAVSYSKGCYLGQEVVARLHYRGQVARRLVRLEGEAGEVPMAGSEVFHKDRPAGHITSAVRSPASGCIVALAMLRRAASEPGTVVVLAGDLKARVV